MRNRYPLSILGALGVAAVCTAGCIDLVAEYYTPLTDPNLFDGGADGGGGEGGSKPDCAGEPSAKNTLDVCGVFVQADAASATGDGTMAHPFASLQKALDNLGGKARVYACTSAPLAEAVTIAASVEVYGGLDCTKGWSWSKDARTQINGPADKVALTIAKAAEGAKVEGFTITAASPSDMKGGGSSIAVAVDDVAATLARCEVTAGDAADGADGETPSDPVIKGADAPTMSAAGAPTDACVVQAGVAGGEPGVTTCDDGPTSGGKGGSGGITGMPDGLGLAGTDGQPADAVKGKGGSGADAANDCNDGTKGKSGDPGGPGLGGSAVGDKLSLTAVTSDDVTDGKAGTKAQGGGAGGGAKSGVFCKVGANTFDGPGASGGGGGAGGCGGKGGGGGKAGGSSIAILSLGTKLVLTEVSLAVGKAGKGGGGVIGQGGGAAGHGSDGGAASGQAGSKPGCKGGDGGLGGDGGPGGGGRGGHAIGLAYASAPASAPVVKTFTPGTAGPGGAVGTGGPMSSNGASGNAATCWDFGKGAACGM